jgi:hypothetical protein
MLQTWQPLAFHWELDTIADSEGRTVELTDTTTFNLLTPEGVVTCRFEKQLNAEQYDILFQFVRRAESRQELESYLLRLADKWGTAVAIEK